MSSAYITFVQSFIFCSFFCPDFCSDKKVITRWIRRKKEIQAIVSNLPLPVELIVADVNDIQIQWADTPCISSEQHAFTLLTWSSNCQWNIQHSIQLSTTTTITTVTARALSKSRFIKMWFRLVGRVWIPRKRENEKKERSTSPTDRILELCRMSIEWLRRLKCEMEKCRKVIDNCCRSSSFACQTRVEMNYAISSTNRQRKDFLFFLHLFSKLALRHECD